MISPKDLYEKIMKLREIAEETKEEYEFLIDRILDTIADIVILNLNASLKIGKKDKISPGEVMLATLMTIDELNSFLKEKTSSATIYDMVMSKVQDKIEFSRSSYSETLKKSGEKFLNGERRLEPS